MAWVQFLLCVLAIGFAGAKLSRYGDVIADKTGLGGTWIGVVLLAGVTSLPELVAGISSVTVAAAPDIAVGDVLGSCIFNLLLIAVLDFMSRNESIYCRSDQGHILAAGFGIILMGVAGFNLLPTGFGGVAVLHVGLYSPAIGILYIVAMRTVFLYESQSTNGSQGTAGDAYPEFTLKTAVVRYILAALVVLVAGVQLPFVAKVIAVEMGWHEDFVGTLFVAFVTSLPEMVVTLAALRLGAVDMAIGNLFGSNIFNIGILAIDDIFYLPGPLLDAVSTNHALSAFSAIMMTGIAIVGLIYRPRIRIFNTMRWASVFLIVIYLINTYVLYSH